VDEGTQRAASDEMPPWTPKLLNRVLLYVVGAILLFNVARRLGDILFTIFIAFFLSLALEPGVKWLNARGWKRGLATFAVMGVFFLAGLLMLAIMIPAVVSQTEALIRALPDWLDKTSTNAERWFHVDLSTRNLQTEIGKLGNNLASNAANLAGNILGIGSAIVGGIFKLMTIGLFTFYFVADGPRFRRAVCSLLPPREQERVLYAWDVAIGKTGGYLYSRLLLALISGVTSFLFMSALGVPFALPLAVWVGAISQFVPAVGTYIAMVLPLLVAVFADPMDTVWLLIFFTLYQQFENYILSPRITARTMKLHPAIAFGSAMVGATIAGPVGAFLALPVAATLQSGVLIYFVKKHDVIENELTDADESDADESDEGDGVKRESVSRGFFRRDPPTGSA
jgi:predicted PurR-regulated permease PerM